MQATRTTDAARLDSLTRKHSAFASFDEMLNALGGYRPSMHTHDWRNDELKELAEAYDKAQAARGDDRRVFRY